MRRKFHGKLLFLLLVFGLVFINFNNPIKTVSAEENFYEDQYQIQLGAARFYVVNLTSNANLYINCTAFYKGVFYVYLFDERPDENQFLSNDLLDPSVIDQAVAYNETPSLIYSENLNDTVSFVTLNYTASSHQLYYLEIIIVENGPDTFKLESSYALQAYYIPFIPGFSLEIFASCAVFTAFLIYFKIRKRRK